MGARGLVLLTAISACVVSSIRGDPGSGGCQLAIENQLSSGKHIFEHGGLDRKFRVHVPRKYDPSTPTKVMLMFHGWGEDEDSLITATKSVRKLADQKNYILVAPSGLSDLDTGTNDPWMTYNAWSFRGSSSGVGPGPANEPICKRPTAIKTTHGYNYESCQGKSGKNVNKCAWTHCAADDVDFTRELVAHIKSKLCVDESNVFAMGGSNGGMFTWELGQNPATAPLLRAIAPVIGLPARGYADKKGKDSPMPVLVMSGMKDDTVPPGKWSSEDPTESSDEVGFLYESATKITKVWAEEAGCNTSQERRGVKPRVLKAKGFRCKSWCSDSSSKKMPQVIDCRNAKLGHDYNMGVTMGAIFQFFDAHSA